MDGSASIDNKNCPSDEVLNAILNLRSNDELALQVRDHLNDCKRCQRRLDRLTSAPNLKAVHKQVQSGLGDSARRLVSSIAKSFSQKLDGRSSDQNRIAETQVVNGDTEVSKDGLEADVPTPNEQSDLPKSIGRYSILKELGKGGSGVVFLAFDPSINRKIAIKRIHNTRAGQSKRLIREANAAARLQVDEVVRIYSIETDEDGSPFITMEYIDGQTLADEIKQSQYLTTERAVSICCSVARAIQAAHDIGILHRDVKPGNILLDKQGNAKLADFGLAQMAETSPQLTKTGMLLGTPVYMSPEQASGDELDSRSDVYGLGCVLYESLTGSMPFHGTTHQVLKQVAEDQPVSMLKLNENVPKSLDIIGAMAMAKRPENRYQSANDFRLDLEAALNGDAIVARPETAVQSALRWYGKNKRIAWLSGTIAALLVLTTIIAVVSARQIADNSQKAIRASEKSQQLAAAAAEQRALAVETLSELVFDIQNELKGKPGTIKVRQSILDTALNGLQKVVENENEFAIDHSNCTAYLRMADIEMSRGNDEASAKYYEKAQSIARDICEQFPEELKGKINLGNALLGLADLKATNYQFTEAIVGYTEVAEIRKAIAAQDPSADYQSDYARILGRLGSALSGTGKYVEAIEYYRQAVGIMQSFPSEIANDPTFARSYVVASAGLATQFILTNQIDQAKVVIESIEPVLERLLTLDPYNNEYLLDAAVIFGQFTQIHSQKYEWSQANSFATKTRQTHERIVESSPNNDWSRSNLGLSWSTEALTHLALNDLDAARSAWEEDFRQQMRVLENNPANVRFVLPAAEAAVYLAGIAFRESQLDVALEHAQQSQGLIAQIPSELVMSNPMVQRASVIGNALPQAIKNTMEFLKGDAEELPVASDVQKYTVAFIAYQKSLANDRQEVEKLAASLRGASFENPLFREYVSFSLAAAFSKLLSFAKSSGEAEAIQKQLIARAIENLDLYMSAPAYLQFVMMDPDFAELRMTQPFADAVKRWTSPN